MKEGVLLVTAWRQQTQAGWLQQLNQEAGLVTSIPTAIPHTDGQERNVVKAHTDKVVRFCTTGYLVESCVTSFVPISSASLTSLFAAVQCLSVATAIRGYKHGSFPSELPVSTGAASSAPSACQLEALDPALCIRFFHWDGSKNSDIWTKACLF